MGSSEIWLVQVFWASGKVETFWREEEKYAIDLYRKYKAQKLAYYVVPPVRVQKVSPKLRVRYPTP